MSYSRSKFKIVLVEWRLTNNSISRSLDSIQGGFFEDDDLQQYGFDSDKQIEAREKEDRRKKKGLKNTDEDVK